MASYPTCPLCLHDVRQHDLETGSNLRVCCRSTDPTKTTCQECRANMARLVQERNADRKADY